MASTDAAPLQGVPPPDTQGRTTTNVFIDPSIMRGASSAAGGGSGGVATGHDMSNFVIQENVRLQGEVQSLRKSLAASSRANDRLESDNDSMERNKVCLKGILHNEIERSAALKQVSELYCQATREAKRSIRGLAARAGAVMALIAAACFAASFSAAHFALDFMSSVEEQASFTGGSSFTGDPSFDEASCECSSFALNSVRGLRAALWMISAAGILGGCLFTSRNNAVARLLAIEASEEMLDLRSRLFKIDTANAHIHDLVDNL